MAMDHENDIYTQAEEIKKQQKRDERKKKRKAWSDRFWKAFLFTENGKPKSGFFIYTFCMSIGMIALYIVAFALLIDPLASLTESLPLFAGNLLGSLCVSAAVLLVGFLLHRLIADKRMMFGTYLWLAVYTVAGIITMAILLGDAEAMGLFMRFALWFVIIPVALGLVLFFLLYRRDYHPESKAAPEEPEWKKYVHRS